MDAPLPSKVSRSNTTDLYLIRQEKFRTGKPFYGEILQVKAETARKPRRIKAVCFTDLHEMKRFSIYQCYKMTLRKKGIEHIPPYQLLDSRNTFMKFQLKTLGENENPDIFYEMYSKDITTLASHKKDLEELEQIYRLEKETISFDTSETYIERWNGSGWDRSVITNNFPPAPQILNIYHIKITSNARKELILGVVIVTYAASRTEPEKKPKRITAYLFDNKFEMKDWSNYLRYKIAMRNQGVASVPTYEKLDANNTAYFEELCNVKDTDNVEEIKQKYALEFNDQVIKFTRLNPKERFDLDKFVTFREQEYREEKIREKKNEFINKYISQLQTQETNNLYLYCGIGLNEDNRPKAVEKTIEGDYIVRDFDAYLRPFLRYLVRKPYNRTPSAGMQDIGNIYKTIRGLRKQFISIIKSIDEIKEYWLYKEDTLVAYKLDGQFVIVNENLYDRLIQEPTQEELYKIASLKITEDFIAEAVRLQDIPPHLATILRTRHLNQMVDYAMYSSPSGINRIHARKIVTEEITPLNDEESSYFWHLEYYLHGKIDKKKERERVVNFDAFRNQIKRNNMRVKYVYNYLKGKISLDELGITSDNARDFLQIVKAVDLCIAYINSQSIDKIEIYSSYDIRCRIMSLARRMSTCEAFTKTLIEKKWSDANYCKRISSWLPHRVNQQYIVMVRNFIQMKLLSNDLGHIFILRGNTASGKSSATTHISNQEAINDPDNLKFPLRKLHYSRGVLQVPNRSPRREVVRVLNKYVHREVAEIADRYFGEVRSSTKLYYVYDSRMTTVEKLKEGAFEPAAIRDSNIVIHDSEVPYITSCVRVLARKVHERPPVVELKGIGEGHILIREQRNSVMDEIDRNERVVKYELHYMNKLVAKKVPGEGIKVIDDNLFLECLRVPEKEEIKAILSTKIDADFIKKSKERNDFRKEEDYAFLEYWANKNVTIKEALEAHEEGEEPAEETIQDKKLDVNDPIYAKLVNKYIAASDSDRLRSTAELTEIKRIDNLVAFKIFCDKCDNRAFSSVAFIRIIQMNENIFRFQDGADVEHEISAPGVHKIVNAGKGHYNVINIGPHVHKRKLA